MGDACAAIGIIRRMGLGKVRHLNTRLVVGSREGSVTDHDSIRRHTEARVSVHVWEGSNRIHCQQFECTKCAWRNLHWKWRASSRQKEGWTRGREWTCTAKLTRPRKGGGPTWRDVAYRVTADVRCGEIISIQDATMINRDGGAQTG